MNFTSANRQRLAAAGKLVLALLILGFLLYQVRQQAGFSRLVQQEKDWRLLGLGAVTVIVSVTLSFFRWYLLVVALDLKIRLVDAIRWGAIAFALNFVALGNIGGDVFKAVFIARDQPGRRAAAVATILVDRVFGLFTFLVLASAAVLLSDAIDDSSPAIALLSRTTLLCTAIGWAGILLVLFVPALTGKWLESRIERIPVAGPISVQLLEALAAYRRCKLRLLGAFLVSVVVDVLFVVSFYLIATGLPMEAPSLGEHFVVVPMSLVAGSIPVTPSGLGTLEAAVEALYQLLGFGQGTGTLTALAHRLAMMLAAAIGVAFYITQRREVRDCQQPSPENPDGDLASDQS